jgi:hypothetical protein
MTAQLDSSPQRDFFATALAQPSPRRSLLGHRFLGVRNIGATAFPIATVI